MCKCEIKQGDKDRENTKQDKYRNGKKKKWLSMKEMQKERQIDGERERKVKKSQKQ